MVLRGARAPPWPAPWGVYFTLAAVYGGLLLLMRVWWGMTRLYARCPGVPVKRMMWVFALWSLPMLVIAPLFSRDAYSYAAQGEMVSHHMNPYLYGPFELGNNAYTAPVDQLWGNAPAPYGPLFLQIDGFFARITFHNELATIVLLRLLALVGVLLIAACVPRLARLYHRDGAELFTLMVLNPVTLLHLIGGAHNDALMLGLLVAGLTAAKEKRPIVGILLCALATAIKAPAALGILYIGWSWLGPQASDPRPDTAGGHRRPDRRRRARVLLLRQRARLGVGHHPRHPGGGPVVDRADHLAGPRRSPASPTSSTSASGSAACCRSPGSSGCWRPASPGSGCC